MLVIAAHLASFLPGWLQEPSWLRPLTRAVRLFILNHQTGGLFFVIFFEELGVPLPAPGDAAIAYGGEPPDNRAGPYPTAPPAGVCRAARGATADPPPARPAVDASLPRLRRYIVSTYAH